MKSKEALNTLKKEFETLSQKLRELTDEELAQVTGGAGAFVIGPFGPIYLSDLPPEEAEKLSQGTSEYIENYYLK